MQFRSIFAGELSETHVGKQVQLAGWVQKRRDLGGVIFVDLRDRSGIVQLVFRQDVNEEALVKADRLRSEFVIQVEGTTVLRAPEAVNPKIATGTLEVHQQIQRRVDLGLPTC